MCCRLAMSDFVAGGVLGAFVLLLGALGTWRWPEWVAEVWRDLSDW